MPYLPLAEPLRPRTRFTTTYLPRPLSSVICKTCYCEAPLSSLSTTSIAPTILFWPTDVLYPTILDKMSLMHVSCTCVRQQLLQNSRKTGLLLNCRTVFVLPSSNDNCWFHDLIFLSAPTLISLLNMRIRAVDCASSWFQLAELWHRHFPFNPSGKRTALKFIWTIH